MMNTIHESQIEQIFLDILHRENGYSVLSGLAVSEGPRKEREYTETILQNRLQAALQRLNPTLLDEARYEAFKKTKRVVSETLLDNNGPWLLQEMSSKTFTALESPLE